MNTPTINGYTIDFAPYADEYYFSATAGVRATRHSDSSIVKFATPCEMLSHFGTPSVDAMFRNDVLKTFEIQDREAAVQ
jgi:hypothetical protein